MPGLISIWKISDKPTPPDDVSWSARLPDTHLSHPSSNRRSRIRAPTSPLRCTLIVFSDEWLAEGHDYINQFLNVAFTGKTPTQYEQENGRTNDDLLTTLKTLEGYNRDFFIVFAHVEAASGLWHEIDGGRMQEPAANPLVQKYCLGFQKVRTHDKPDAKCRVKVKQWWGDQYPAEVEGCDGKSTTVLAEADLC